MALNGGKSTFLSNDSTFVSPSTCFHLTSHILHSPTCSPSASLFPVSLCLSFFFSTDNRQSSHAVHLLRFWRRPSESPNTLSFSSNLTLAVFHLTSACISFLPVFCHCLLLWIPLTPLLPRWFSVPLFQAWFHYSLSFLFQFNVCS